VIADSHADAAFRDGAASAHRLLRRHKIDTAGIGFSADWKDHDAYQRTFARMLRDLKGETA